MNRIRILFGFLLLIGCNDSEDSTAWECYVGQYNQESKECIEFIQSSFWTTIEKMYPQANSDSDRLFIYTEELLEDSVETEAERLMLKKIEQQMTISGFLEIYQNRQRYNSKYLSSHKPCASHDELISSYLDSYEIVGDIDPQVFVQNIHENAPEMVTKPLTVHHLIMEVFLPRILNN